MKRTIFILLLGTVAISSCKKEVSNKVDQSKIWTNYELYYNQSSDRTFATATFQFSNSGGSILELSEPSEVTFNDQPMSFNTETGTYNMEFGGFLTTGDFDWVDTDGNAYSNTAVIHDIAFGTLEDTIYKSDGDAVFTWDGDALAEDESVVLEMVGSDGSFTQRFSSDTVGATTIRLDSMSLSLITSGDVTLNLELLYTPDLQEETERGGRLAGRYIPVDQTIFLADSVQ